MRICKSYFSIALWITLLTAVGAANAWGQSQFGSIRGLVIDQNQALVPNAEVRATNQATGMRFKTVSLGTGDYLITGVLPGVYTVEAALAGFKDFRITDIVVQPGDVARADLTLEVGATTESVTVRGEVTPLETQSGSIESSTSAAYLENPAQIVPEEETLANTLLPLLPGQTLSGARSVIAYGSRSYDRRITLDGVALGYNLIIGRTPPGTVVQMQSESLDANSEHQTSNTTKMFTTKGGNDLHGAVWSELRNDALNALPWYDGPGAKRPPGIPTLGLGYSVGGPVYIPKLYNGRNKTFFFTSFETIHKSWASPRSQTVPSAQMQKGDLSELGTTIIDPLNGQPFANSVIPASRISPVASNTLSKFYPAVSSFYSQNYLQPLTYSQPIHDLFVRIDQQFGQRNTLSFSYLRNIDQFGWTAGVGPQYGPGTAANVDHQNMLNISDVHIITPTLVNEANFGMRMGPFGTTQTAAFKGKQISAGLGLPVAAGAPDIFGGPEFDISGIQSLSFQQSSFSDGRGYTARDNLSWTHGRYTSKVGFELLKFTSQSDDYETPFGTFSFSGLFTNTGFGDFLLGLPSSTYRSLGSPNTDVASRAIGVFVDEEIRVTKRFNLSVGLRFQYNGAPSEGLGRFYNFDLKTGDLVVPSSSSLASVNPGLSSDLAARIVTAQSAGFPSQLINPLKALNPRFGMAYQLFKNTVLRGGYGMYAGANAERAQLGGFAGGPFAAGSESYTNGTVCDATGSCLPDFTLANPFPGGGTNAVSGLSVKGVNPHLRTPETNQWNATVEQRLPGSFLWRTSYVGSRSEQLPYRRDANLPPASTIPFTQARLIYPEWYSVRYTDSGGNQSFNGLQTGLSRSWASGTDFTLTYSLSKCITDVDESGLEYSWGTLGANGPIIEDPYNRARDKGNCEIVPRQDLRSLFTASVPFGKGRAFLRNPTGFGMGLLNAIVGGWRVSGSFLARSGYFATPEWSGVDSANTGQTLIRPDLVGSIASTNFGPFNLFNPAGFAAPQPGHYGTAGHGIIETNGGWFFDAGIYKTFTFSDNERMPRFRVGMTTNNVLNHPSYGYSDTGPFTANNHVTAGKSDDMIYTSGTNANLGAMRLIRFNLQIQF